MNRWDRGAVTLLVAALAVVAAGMLVQLAPPRPAATPVSAAPTVAYREGVLGHATSVNPLTARTQADRDLVALLFRGLVRAGADGKLVPDLALSWTVSDDGKQYLFLLRPDAVWQDGVPVTASDVVFTVGLLQSPAYDGPLGASWRGIRVVAVDDRLVRFELTIPLAGFLEAATLPLLPVHLLAGTPTELLAGSDFNLSPLGNGPYTLIDLDDQHAVLERSGIVLPTEGAFPLPSLGLPTPALPTANSATLPPLGRRDGIDRIELRFFDDPAALETELRAGRLDAAGGLPAGDVAALAAIPGARLVRYPEATVTSIVLNQRPDHAALRTPDVHVALLAAIDRAGLVRDVLGGYGVAAEIPVAPFSWAYQASSVTPVAFDPAAAEAGLVRAGWRKAAGGWTAPGTTATFPITLLAPDAGTNATARATAEGVAAAWRAIGFEVSLVALPAADYVARLRAGNFDAAVVDFELGRDPDLSPLLLSSQSVTSGSNVSGIQNADLDKLLIAARTAVGEEARGTALAAVEHYLSTNQPILALYFRDYAFVVSTRVAGVASSQVVDPSGRYWDVVDWRLASDR